MNFGSSNTCLLSMNINVTVVSLSIYDNLSGGGYYASLRARPFFCEPRASFASPQIFPPKNPKKDIMPYYGL